MATKKKVVRRKKPVKKAAATKRALNKTIISLRKEAAALEAFVATLSISEEVPLTRKRAVKKRPAKKAAKKKVVKKKVAKKKK
jgi:hypothetical protein